MKEVKVIVEGGKATPQPPLGPALAALKMNVGEVVGAINEATKVFAGTKVPVTVRVDEKTKKYELEVGRPSIGEMIRKEAGLEKGGGTKDFAGDIKLAKIIEIARKKGGNLKSSTLEVLGTCLSMRVKCEGKDPKEVIKEVKDGHYESLFA